MLHTQQELYAAYVDCCPFSSPFVDSLALRDGSEPLMTLSFLTRLQYPSVREDRW